MTIHGKMSIMLLRSVKEIQVDLLLMEKSVMVYVNKRKLKTAH